MAPTENPNIKSKRWSHQSTAAATKCDSECPRGEDKRTLPQLLMMTTRKRRQNYGRVAVLKLGVGRAIPKCQAYVRELANLIWSTLSPHSHSPARVNPGHERQSERNREPEFECGPIGWTTAGSACVLPLVKAEHGGHSAPETQEEDLDLTPHTLDEVVQLICESWERGLKDSTCFRVLLSRLNELLAEGAGGEVADGKALEDAERNQILVYSGREEDHGSSTSWDRCLDTSSTESEYTVRSIRSFKERTNHFFRPRSNTSSHRAVSVLQHP